MSYCAGPIGWRLPIAVQIVFALFVIVLLIGLPESPRWLFNHGRHEEAMAVLTSVYDKAHNDPSIVEEKNAILAAIELEEREVNVRSFLTIFKRDGVRTRYRILLGWCISCINQVSGINLVVFYIPCE